MNIQGYEIDTTRYLINPFSENLLEQAKKYEEFNEDFNLPKLETVRYIILMYDIKTSLKLDVRDFWERKRISALVAGFRLNKKKEFEEDVEKMLLGENDAVNNAVVKYILLFGMTAYSAQIIYYTRLVHEVQKTLRGSSKTSLKDIDTLKNKIEECEEELFGGKEILNARKALYSKIEKERKAEKPEEIIKRLNEGDDLSEMSAYGNYKPDPLKFEGDE